MNKIKSICLSAALLISASSVMAAPANNNVRGAYAGFEAGSANMVIDDVTTEFDDVNLRAFLGYQLNRYFAVEGGLSMMPFDDLLSDVADISGMDVSVLAKLPITPRMSAYARLGYWDWDVSSTYNGTYFDWFGDTDMLYGIGMEYNVSSRFKLRLDATRYEASDAEIDTLSGSIAYNF